MKRSLITLVVLLVATFLMIAGFAKANVDFPAKGKTITIIVPLAAGGQPRWALDCSPMGWRRPWGSPSRWLTDLARADRRA